MGVLPVPIPPELYDACSGEVASDLGGSNPPRMMIWAFSPEREEGPLSALTPFLAVEGDVVRLEDDDDLLAAFSLDASMSACCMYLRDSVSKVSRI